MRNVFDVCKNKGFGAAIMQHLVRAANLSLFLLPVLKSGINPWVLESSKFQTIYKIC